MSASSFGSNQVLRLALAYAATDPSKALEQLRSGLAHARESGDGQGVSSLARHAAIISVHLGDIEGAIHYYEEAQEHDPDDSYLFLASGSLRRQLGQFAEARTAFSRALALAQEQGDAEVVKLATESLKGSPDADV